MGYRIQPIIAIILLSLSLGLSGCSSDSGRWAHEGDGRERTGPLGTRSITLVHQISNERFSGIYVQDGAYVPGALNALNMLLRDQRTGEVRNMDPRLYNFLTDLRQTLKLRDDQPFMVLSAYRSPSTNNAEASSARQSLHTKGMAVDIRIPGVPSRLVASVAETLQRGGVSYYPRTDHVHLDVGMVRAWGAGRTSE